MTHAELQQALARGEITAEDALIEANRLPAVHISDISIDNLKVEVLECGFPSIDEDMVFKKGRGELIIFGARPSMGKSTFLFQVASHIAQEGNVLIYSLEMDRESIKGRITSALCGISMTVIQKGIMDDHHRDTLKRKLPQINALNYYIDDRSALDVREIASSAVRHHQDHPISLVVVDYLQLVKSRERDSRNDEIGEVTNELKALAKDLKCPVLVASQLNRQCEVRGKQDGNYIPVMSDLRDSGNIEQDADVIMFLSRQEVYDGNRQGTADISIAKSRNGVTNNHVFDWQGAYCRFVDTEGLKKLQRF